MQNLSLERLNKRHPNITQRSEVIHYVLAALVAAVIKADGTVTSNETDAAVKIAEQLGMATSTKSEIDAYLKGTDDFRNKEVTINDLIELSQVLKSKNEKMNLLKVLIKISSADGILDKAEYLVISKVAQSFKMAIPEFESLAEKLNVGTGNAARDRQFEIAGNVIKTIGKGVWVTAVLGLKVIDLLLQDGTSKPSKKRTVPSKKQVSVEKPQAKEIFKTYRAGCKYCGFCSHWYGQRTVEPNKKQVLIALHGQPRGVCSKSPGGKRLVIASHTCAEFSPVI